MFTSLSPGAIGVQVDNLQHGLALAARHGFDGYHFGIGEAHDLGVTRVQELSEETGVRLSAFGFPLDFRGDEAAFEQDLAALPALAQTAADLDVRRTATWITPASDELSFADNMALHVQRLTPATAILADHGIRLGLEYVGPKTSRTGKKYEFVHTMDQMSALCIAVGNGCGYLLDAWHWYTAHEDAPYLQRLSPEQVVDVHVNDAPDRPVDEQLDNQRCLPGETGVIDIATFLGSLKQIGYDGPVMVEPFSQDVRDMTPDDACAATRAALGKVWTQARLAGQ
jgi:sugar phosphate isomerase/epimerase